MGKGAHLAESVTQHMSTAFACKSLYLVPGCWISAIHGRDQPHPTLVNVVSACSPLDLPPNHVRLVTHSPQAQCCWLSAAACATDVVLELPCVRSAEPRTGLIRLVPLLGLAEGATWPEIGLAICATTAWIGGKCTHQLRTCNTDSATHNHHLGCASHTHYCSTTLLQTAAVLVLTADVIVA